MEIQVSFSSKFVIDSCIKCMGTHIWAKATWLYGTRYRAEKENFWAWMEHNFGPSDMPWSSGGDFNEFLWE